MTALIKINEKKMTALTFFFVPCIQNWLRFSELFLRSVKVK